MERRNSLRSLLAATLSVVVVVALGLTVRPDPAGAAGFRVFEIKVTDTGFRLLLPDGQTGPAVIPDANVNDRLKFVLEASTDKHRVIFEDNSICRGGVPCWPELHFDGDHDNCFNSDGFIPNARCMVVADPGKTVRFHDHYNAASVGEVTVLGQSTTTTGPATTTTTRPPTTTTTAPPTSTTMPTTATTGPQTTTTTAPTQVRPFVIPDSPSTTSTIAPPVSISNNGAAPPPTTGGKDKGKGKDDKAKSKAAGTETPTTVTPMTPDAFPPGTVFDPSSLTPSPEAMPGVPGDPGPDDVNLESSAIMNLLDGVEDDGESTDWGPLLLAMGGLALVLSIGGICIWFGRPSRFDPA